MWRGTLEGNFCDAEIGGDGVAQAECVNAFPFEPADGNARFSIPIDEIRAIYLGADGELDSHGSLRFFDAVPVPAFLWVRLTFMDGEVLEGMVKNHFSAFNDPLISLSIPDPSAEQIPVLVPRCVVAELQVITTR